MNIIQARQNILGKDNHFITNLTETDKNHWRQDLAQHCEPFVWDWTYHRDSPPTHIDDGVKIGSMLGKSKIIDLVKKIHPSTNILYSGVGADEIMARNQFYSRGWGNVDYFPEDLSQVYPWANLFKGSMENYLKGEEYVGGRYSFETRYPFCDTKLVQEYLWLKAELKNTYISSHQKTMLLDLSTRQKYGSETYKPPLQHYLTINNFPYHVQKLGFAV